MVSWVHRGFPERRRNQWIDLVRITILTSLLHLTAEITHVLSFTPSIVASLGYTANKAQLMSVPPYAVAFVRAYRLRLFCFFEPIVKAMLIHLT